jgi:hypothetical protein
MDPVSVLRETRRPLFNKGRHAFLLILSRKERLKKTSLDKEPFREARLKGAIDRFFGHEHAGASERGDLIGGL